MMRRRMKKTVIGILAATMMLSAGATGVSAAGRGYGRNFVDADGDGVCDYAGSGNGYTDADGDGVCDNYGTRQGRGFGCRRNR